MRYRTGALIPLLAALFAHSGSCAPLSPLHAQGTQIVDATGKTVVLRGVNLGGWLVEEPWMQPFVTKPPAGSPYPPARDHVAIWQTVENRLGSDAKNRVRAAFRKAWVDESDFDRIKANGFNCVRLPFLSSLLDEPGGYGWLDRAVSWAGARGIYVILDLHGAPGGQSDQAHTGQSDVNRFFKDPENIKKTVDIWSRLAKHFRGNSAVAGYDLINEPTGGPNSDTLYVVEDRLYRAVRAEDKDHIVIIEDGYTGLKWMPYPALCDWTNVVFSGHHYNFKAKTEDDQTKGADSMITDVIAQRDKRNVPFYVGEFGLEPNGTIDSLKHLVTAFQNNSLSWSLWTYKVTWSKGGQSQWSLYSNTKPIDPLDPFNDSEADLIKKCDQIKTANLDEYTTMAQVFRDSGTMMPAPAIAAAGVPR